MLDVVKLKRLYVIHKKSLLLIKLKNLHNIKAISPNNIKCDNYGNSKAISTSKLKIKFQQYRNEHSNGCRVALQRFEPHSYSLNFITILMLLRK